MEIAFFGSSLVSSYWNGAATYYRGIIRALHRLGHRITFYEPDAYERQQHRDMEDPDWAEVVVYPPDSVSLYRCLESARNADLIVKASGVGVLDDLLEKEILYLKNARTAVLYWDVDAPATLERLRTNPDDPFRNLLPRYDLILTYGGGQPVIRGYLSLGARQCIPIYNALDPETHFPVPKDPAFAADLAFLGNRLPDRESRMEEFFLQTALKLPNRSFLLAGNGWDDKPMSGNIRYIGHLGTADHNAFNSTPLAVLNINRSSMARYGFSPATRIFEAAGSGACILTDKWEGIEQFLEPGEEILVAETGEHVASLLEGLSREEAARIGRNAMRRIISEHTYEHRARQFHAIFASGPAAVKPEESAASPVFP